MGDNTEGTEFSPQRTNTHCDCFTDNRKGRKVGTRQGYMDIIFKYIKGIKSDHVFEILKLKFILGNAMHIMFV